MKVAFFGRTSNGKSTAINSLLGDKILPTGMGHTRACSHSHSWAVPCVLRNWTQTAEFRFTGLLRNADCWGRRLLSLTLQGLMLRLILMSGLTSTVWTVMSLCWWPMLSPLLCSLRRSSSTRFQRGFPTPISLSFTTGGMLLLERMSRIRSGTSTRREQWPSSPQSWGFAALRRRKTASSSSLLKKLQTRLQEAKGQPPNIHTEDYFTRYLEYQQFEKKLEHCLSSTAVRTKFAAHTARGRDIVVNEGNMIGRVQDTATIRKNEEANNRKEMLDRLDFTERQLEMMTHEMKDKICAIVEDVEYKVAKALSEEMMTHEMKDKICAIVE